MFSFSALWRNLFERRRFERNLSDELSSYAGMLAEENMSRGMKPDDARRAALLEMEGLEQVKENVRDARVGSFLDSLGKDVRHSLRSLSRTRGTTALAIATLALGLGAASLIFSVFYAILLAPLPFAAPERLVQVWQTSQVGAWSQSAFSVPNFSDMRAQNRTFESMAALTYGDSNLTGTGEPAHLATVFVTAQFFHTLGVQPVLGRDFDANADRPGHDHALVLLSYRLWQSRFAGSKTVLGTILRLNDSPFTVIGVMPAGDPWLNSGDVFVPMVYSSNVNRGNFEASVIGRIAPGVTFETARADLHRIATDLSRIYREDKGMGVLVSPSAVWGASPVLRRALIVLLGAVSLLLLIACVNVANLLLAKATHRAREFSIREALGASRARLMRLLLTESLLLALCGSVLGLLIASWGLALIRRLTVAGMPRLAEVHLNGWVFSCALLLTLAAALLAGIAPALQTSFRPIGSALREEDRSQTAARGKNRLRSSLVAAEVALAMILLIAAGLLIRSFQRLMNVERGFASSGRILATINMPTTFDDRRAERFTSTLLDRVRSLPGVSAAATVNSEPIVGWDPGMGFGAVDNDRGQERGVPWASWRTVSADYFRAMGIPFLAGRDFQEKEFGAKPVRPIIISAAIANLLWPGQNAVGRRMSLWKGQGNRLGEVVGVVGNTRDHGLDSDPTRIVYLPFIGQNDTPVQLVVASNYSASTLTSSLRGVLAAVEPGIPISQVQTFDALVAGSLGSQRLNTALLSTFALLALLLTLTGIYGVLAYAVARRRQEIGIRLALGASARSILSLVFRQGLQPIAFGLLLGLAGSPALTRVLSRLLFQIHPTDLATYCAVILLIALSAVAACFFPARRALRVDPVIALRE